MGLLEGRFERPRRTGEGGVWLGLVSAPPYPHRECRRGGIDSPILGAAVPGTPPCSAADYWKGRVEARRLPPCAPPAPPGPALPRSGRPRATGPVHSPGPAPKAWLRWAEASEQGREREAAPGQLGLRALEAVKAVRTCPGPRRPPCASPGAARGRGSRRALSPGRLPCGGNGAETRWPRSRPAAPTRALPCSLDPFVPESRSACGS